MAADVFLSYANKDRATADRAIEELERRGISCWVAHRDAKAGEDWASSIVDAIEGSRLVVLIYSAYANDSQQVLREMERAVKSNIPIIPILTEDVPLSKSMRYFLGATHWLDVAGKSEVDQLRLLSDTVSNLLKSTETFLQPTQLVLPAPPALRLLYWAAFVGSLPLIVIGMDNEEFAAGVGSFGLSFGFYGLLWGRRSWQTSLFVGALAGLALFFFLAVVYPIL